MIGEQKIAIIFILYGHEFVIAMNESLWPSLTVIASEKTA